MADTNTASGFPPETITPAVTRVLLALIDQDRPTVRSIGEACGLKSSNTVHFHLKTLRTLGLVAWEPGQHATIRPLVRRVQ